MQYRAGHRRGLHVLALLAALALALLPTLSRAWVASLDAPSAAALCSTAEGTPGQSSPDPSHALEACALCVLVAQGHAPLPASTAIVLPDSATVATPEATRVFAPAPPPPVHPGRPRAPPATALD